MLAFIVATLLASALASSHSEASGTAKRPRSDLSDLYLFRSPADNSRPANVRDQYVTAIMNVNPLQQTQAGPNYSPIDSNFVYSFHFDYDGDYVEDISYQFLFGNRFGGADNEGIKIRTPQGVDQPIALSFVGVIDETDATTNSQDYYRVRVGQGRVNKGDHLDEGEFLKNADTGSTEFLKPFEFAGRKAFGNAKNTAAAYRAYERYAATRQYNNVEVPGCDHPARVFVGSRRESFSLDLGRTFDLLQQTGTSTPQANSLDRFAVTSIVLELHQDCIAVPDKAVGPVIGLYASVRHLEHEGVSEEAHVVGDQVTRLANPLVNELVIGTDRKNDWNAAHPSDDGQFLAFFQDPAFAKIGYDAGVRDGLLPPRALFGPPAGPRNDLVAVFLTGANLRVCNDAANPACTVQFTRQTGAKDDAYADLLRFNLDLARPQTRSAQDEKGLLSFEPTDFQAWPFGRRIGDDIGDIAFNAVFGGLCLPNPTDRLGGPFVGRTVGNLLGACTAADVPLFAFVAGRNPTATPERVARFLLGNTDGATITACDFPSDFPYLNTPVPGDIQFSYDATDAVPEQFRGQQACGAK